VLHREALEGYRSGGGSGGEAVEVGAQRAAYAALAAALPATALHSVLTASSPSAESFAALRRAFTHSAAMHSLLCHLFSVGDRTPARLAVALSSGLLLSSDPRPALGESGAGGGSGLGALSDAPEPVPFRLTRNMVGVITAQGVCGPVAASIAAVARGLHSHYELASALMNSRIACEVFGRRIADLQKIKFSKRANQ
jgi:hypothetical protein